MDLQTIQIVFWLLLFASVVAFFELKESLKAPMCPECYHCQERKAEERRRQAEARDAFARSFEQDHDDDRRPRR